MAFYLLNTAREKVRVFFMTKFQLGVITATALHSIILLNPVSGQEKEAFPKLMEVKGPPALLELRDKYAARLDELKRTVNPASSQRPNVLPNLNTSTELNEFGVAAGRSSNTSYDRV